MRFIFYIHFTNYDKFIYPNSERAKDVKSLGTKHLTMSKISGGFQDIPIKYFISR